MKSEKTAKWYQDLNFYKTIGVCFLIALAAFAVILIKNGGILHLNCDYELQQVPMAIAENRAIKAGNFGWQWSVDLGSSFIGAYSYYGLFNPFKWLYFLLPALVYPYISVLLYILQFAFAGGTAYLFLKRFLKKPSSAIFGAVLYAFSGFGIGNLIFEFHSILVFFPLLLISLEQLVTENKRGRFLLAVLINCALNYYFFVGEVVFVILYYFVRFSKKEIKETLGKVIFESILGVSIAAVVFVPSIAAMLINPRSNTRITDFVFDNDRYLAIFRGLLLPATAKNAFDLVADNYFLFDGAYLPAVGLSFTIAYFYRHNKKDWIKRILIIGLIAALVPFMGSAFSAFTTTYMRWWYMPILIAALASAKVFEDYKNYPIRKGIVINILLIGIFAIYVAITDKITMDNFYITATLGLCGLILIWLFTHIDYFHKTVSVVTICVAVITGIWGTVGYNIGDWMNELPETRATIDDIKVPDDNYRFLPTTDYADSLTTNNYLAFIADAQPVLAYTSTPSGRIWELYDAFDEDRHVGDDIFTDSLSTAYSWIAGKYLLVDKKNENTAELNLEAEAIVYENDRYYVLERPACPMAYVYDSYILREDFDALSARARQLVAMEALVANEEIPNLKRVEKYNGNSKTELIEQASKKALRLENKTTYGFTLTGVKNYENEYAFISVPADPGWTATANGEKLAIMNNLGLMAIKIPAGAETIEFKYETPDLRLGAVITTCGITALALWQFKILWYNKKQHGK